MKLRLIILGLVLIAVSSLQAQSKKWTLRACVEHAWENNISVKQSELDLELAEINKKDAFGAFLPSVNARAGHSWNIGLNQNITTGLLENLTTQFSSGGLNASIDIFNGLQNVNRLKKARLAAEASQYQLDNIKDDIALNVANSFLQVLFNRESLNAAKAQYEVTKQNLDRTKELVENGVVPRGNILDIEATAATQQQQIVNAENGLMLAKISLAQLLLIEDYANFDVLDEGYMIPPATIMEKSANEIYEKALTFRNDIKNSEMSVKSAELDVKLAKGTLLPTLSGSYGFNTRISYQDRVIGAVPDTNNPFAVIGQVEGTGENVVRPNFASVIGAHDNIMDQLSDNLGHSFGLNLSIPVFNGFSARNSVKRSRVNLEKAKYRFHQDKLNLNNTVYQAWNNTIGAQKSYEAAAKTLEARELALQYAKDRFEVGLMNAFDYSQAQARVDNAKAEHIRSKYDYIFKLKVLEFYFGIPIYELK
ncbi:MAG: TolC family protein [Flavobacteriaceae bacterium]|nr:TolC family protein [Flavobacteriaceae bacterium]